MSAGGDIWALPGPAGFVQDIARFASDGRHVVAVLPRRLTENLDSTDSLAGAIVDRLEVGRRLYPLSSEGSLVESLGHQATDGFGDAPATLSDLITHDDLVHRALVVVASDLEAPHQAELGRFLLRLEEVSRPIPASRRGTFVVITDRMAVPAFAGKETSDVGLTSVWFWNRVARWDVAAFLATVGHAETGPAILREAMTETIIEVARWNLDHAHKLATSWSGSEAELTNFVDVHDDISSGDLPRIRPQGRPSESMLSAWDVGAYECWHDRPAISPLIDKSQRNRMSRHLWSAQARVILPWIEVRRSEVEEVVRTRLGSVRMDAALEQTHIERRERAEQHAPPEIGQLRAIVRARLGQEHPRLINTVDALWKARNKLAHLEPLSHASLQNLIETCNWLDRATNERR